MDVPPAEAPSAEDFELLERGVKWVTHDTTCSYVMSRRECDCPRMMLANATRRVLGAAKEAERLRQERDAACEAVAYWTREHNTLGLRVETLEAALRAIVAAFEHEVSTQECNLESLRRLNIARAALAPSREPE